MKLRIRAMGSAVGVVFGLAVFLATLYSLWFGGGTVIGTLAHILPGFQRSYGGAFLGLFEGIIWGFVGGALVAWFYNSFHKVLYKSAQTT